MTRDLALESQVQLILNDLLAEGLIPFALNAGKIAKSRRYLHRPLLRYSQASPDPRHALAEAVRTAVLDRVTKLSGPFGGKPLT